MNSPAPSETELAQSVRAMYNEHPFPNYYSHLPSQSDERFRYIFTKFLHLPLEAFQGKIIFDAGCGTGENTWAWQRILGSSAEIIGLDQSEGSIRIAHGNYPEQTMRPDFVIGSLLDLGLADNSVDAIFCSGVLVAVTEPWHAYQELVRVLKPGGYIVLIMYHRYGRALHGIRRAVVDLLEKKDINRRAQLGGKLFGRSMKKLSAQTHSPYEGVLYDQFGLPCESRYTVGQVCKWYRKANIQYIGSWPPVEWSQFGKALRFSYHLLSGQRNAPLKRLLIRIFPDMDKYSTRVPSVFSRASMQLLWAFGQQQLFAVSGRKE
jgi:ubiquinone/menaquinone biosynthesis C-methylase UbiE